ncbi:hypothetical protein DFH09DRAFT_1396398 [Mycena vulgaris]|nr:hypothetical protein DFH09DRAFT_1396398 [Mycena vulgaris]
MARDDLDLFRGDNKGYKPHYWLKKLKGTMAHDAVDAACLWKFENGLASGAPAEVWFEALPAAEKTTWVELMKAFKKKWPVPVEMAATKEELMDRIKSTILRAEDLGKTVGPPGDEMTAHQRWVADMWPLLEDIGDPTMLLRRDVRETLPLEVRSLLPAQGLTTWDKFFAAVDGIEVVSIRDELERSARATGARDARAEEDAALWALIPGFQAFLASTSGPQYQGYRATSAPRVTYPSAPTPQRAPTTPQQPVAQPAAYRQPLQSPSQPPVTPQRAVPDPLLAYERRGFCGEPANEYGQNALTITVFERRESNPVQLLDFNLPIPRSAVMRRTPRPIPFEPTNVERLSRLCGGFGRNGYIEGEAQSLTRARGVERRPAN